MGNARTCVTHEYEMYSVRTYVTYRNIICPNVCYKRKYDVFVSELILHMPGVRTYIIRKGVMCEPMLHTKI